MAQKRVRCPVMPRSQIKGPYPQLIQRMLAIANKEYGVLWNTSRKDNGRVFYVYHPRDGVQVVVSISYKGAVTLLRLMREEAFIKESSNAV